MHGCLGRGVVEYSVDIVDEHLPISLKLLAAGSCCSEKDLLLPLPKQMLDLANEEREGVKRVACGPPERGRESFAQLQSYG